MSDAPPNHLLAATRLLMEWGILRTNIAELEKASPALARMVRRKILAEAAAWTAEEGRNAS